MLYQLWGGSFNSSISKFLQPHLVVVYKFSIILRQSCYLIKSRTFIHSASGFGHFVCPSSQSRYTCFTHLQKAFCHKPSRTTELQVRQVLLNNLVWNTWKTDKLIEKCACGSAIEWMTTFSLSILLFSLNWIVITHLVKSNVIRVFFFSQLRHAEQRLSNPIMRKMVESILWAQSSQCSSVSCELVRTAIGKLPCTQGKSRIYNKSSLNQMTGWC